MTSTLSLKVTHTWAQVVIMVMKIKWNSGANIKHVQSISLNYSIEKSYKLVVSYVELTKKVGYRNQTLES